MVQTAETGNSVVPADGGELRLLLHLLCKHFELLLERLFVVIWMNVIIVWNYRRQELGAGKAEQLLKHLKISEQEGEKCFRC